MKQKSATVQNFSLAFERMCNFVAIAQTNSEPGTRRELILQCFVILPDIEFTTAELVVEHIDSIFGISLDIAEVETDLDRLVKEGFLIRSFSSAYALESKKRAEMQQTLEEATQLEVSVRSEWFSQLAINYPRLDHSIMWKALRQYLALLFQRHGLQTVAYIDQSHEISDEDLNGLNVLLRRAVGKIKGISEDEKTDAYKAISDFLANVGQSPTRSMYISQLADGAFNYFSLTVDPEVAKQFRENLEGLTLFLDTNFLFGILNLHANPFVEVSLSILEAVLEHKLPFTLRYHAKTREEFAGAIQYHSEKLQSSNWSQPISRAAIRSQRNLSGIETKYHRQNAERPVDVASFFKPYRYFDQLLREKAVDIYRPASKADSQQKIELMAEYTAFLSSRKKEKPESLIDHDVTVIDAVLELRERSSSSLRAEALLLTCDYTLYKFDQEVSRRKKRRGCVVLPNVFMQMLRPLIPSSVEFDRSFAETFAIPEFRIIGSGAAKATSRLMSILASYRDVKEDTAVKIISNDFLLDRLSTAKDDTEFQELVESEIVNQNNELIEERVALELQIAENKRQQEAQIQELQRSQERIREEEHQKQEALEAAKRERLERETSEEKLRREKEARLIAEQEMRSFEAIAAESAKQVELYINAFWIGIGGLIGILSFFGLQLTQIPFLEELPNPTGARLLIALVVLALVLGTSRPKWRKWLWGVAITSTSLGVIVNIITSWLVP